MYVYVDGWGWWWWWVQGGACMNEDTVSTTSSHPWSITHRIASHGIALHCHSLTILGFLLSYLCALFPLSLCVPLASASLPVCSPWSFRPSCWCSSSSAAAHRLPFSWIGAFMHQSDCQAGGLAELYAQSGRVTSVERKEGSSRGQEGCIFVRGDRWVQQEWCACCASPGRCVVARDVFNDVKRANSGKSRKQRKRM